MVIRITGIDLLTKEKESDPDYVVYVEVGRITDNGAEQVLMFNFEATRVDLLSGNHRKFIEDQVKGKLLEDGPHKFIGDVWRTNGESELPTLDRKKATMAA